MKVQWKHQQRKFFLCYKTDFFSYINFYLFIKFRDSTMSKFGKKKLILNCFLYFYK